MKLNEPYQSGFFQSAFHATFINKWMKVAVAFFLLAALFGTMMRYFFVAEIPFLDYKHILHAHSHVALLGWGYMFVSGALLFLFVGKARNTKVYKYLFLTNVVAVIGMAIFFTCQGYGFYSILFSTIHLISVYVFAYHFCKDLPKKAEYGHYRFVKWSVIWLLVSTLGLWAIAPISILLGKLHPSYYMSIQFFLHFQFNGWFTYAILGLLTYHVAQKTNGRVKISSTAFWLLQLSLLLTYALSITWSTPLSVIFYLNSLGVVLQAVAFFLVLRPIVLNLRLAIKSHWTDWLLFVGIICLLAKAFTQIAVAIPAIATISYTIRNYVIGFIHLIMLGSVTLTGVSILLKHSLLPQNRTSKTGWMLLSFGFIATEVLLFGQGTLLWMKKGFMTYYYEVILAATAILPVALTIVLFGFRRNVLQTQTPT